jgi:DivIVA domain-containing protein
MAISFSRPDPSSPASVSSAQFQTSRRGFDQTEVRDFLRMVAAELARLQERERFLERELRSAQQLRGEGGSSIDDDTATRLLGEEAARILQTAREAAVQIRTRAEDGSARLLREATDEAQRLREEAEIEAARRRQDASSDAEAELNMAKQQGRDMVNEARAYRERVLSELARRRELARQQIEQLIHGRDRLLQAFERSRIAAVEVMAELTPLGEPTEYVNLQPTTGPVPMMVPSDTGSMARPVVDEEAEPESGPRRAAGEADQPHMYDVEAEADDDAADVDAAAGDADVVAVDVVVEEHIEQHVELHIVEPIDDTVVSLPESDRSGDEATDSDREPAPVVNLFAEENGATGATDTSGDKKADSVDDLFAKLRAARSSAVAAGVDPPAPVAAGAEDLVIGGEELESATPTDGEGAEAAGDDQGSVRDVDEAVVPLILSAARKLKRVLADEQNEVLDTLRRKQPVRALDTLLPWEGVQADRYAKAIEDDLIAAAVAGANGSENGRNPAIVRPAYDAVTNEIVAPLRERLTRCIDKADGKNPELASQVRSLYREWKTHRIDEHVEDIVRLAYERGALTVASR